MEFAVVCDKIFSTNNQKIIGLIVKEERIEKLITPEEIKNIGDIPILNYRNCTIVPGFIDSHNHMLTTGLQSLGVPLTPKSQENFESLRETLSDFDRENDFPWIIGRGLNSAYFRENRLPDRYELDKAKIKKPIFLVHMSGHAAVCNSAAIDLANSEEWPLEMEGGKIERRSNNEPTGVLHDKAMELVRQFMPRYTKHDYIMALRMIQDSYSESGLTCIKDTGGDGYPINEEARIDAINELDKNGELKLRIAISIPIFTKEELTAKMKLSAKIKESDKVKFGGYKLFLDGSGISKTAWMKEPWITDGEDSDKGNTGLIRWELSDFTYVLGELANQKEMISIHAIGDAALKYALNEIEVIKKRNKDAKFSIVHCYIPSEEDILKIARLGVTIETQPIFLRNFGAQIIENLGPLRGNRLFPIKSYIKQGVNICITSDSPVASFNPVLSLFTSMTRIVSYEHGVTISHMKSERTELDETLLCMTENPAKAIDNKNIGTLSRGKLADFVVFNSIDLSKLANEDFSHVTSMRPVAVYVSGREINPSKEVN